METPSVPEKINNWAKNSIGLKIITVIVLVLLLLIPSTRIMRLIDERKTRKDEAVKEVEAKWGMNQSVGGPVISVPFLTRELNSNGKWIEVTRMAHFLPEELNIECYIKPEKLHRSIYDVILYAADLKIKGSFVYPDFNEFSNDILSVDWSHSYISLGISDLRLQNKLKINFNNQISDFKPGLKATDIFANGVSCPLNLELINKDTNLIPFNLEFTLNGSEMLHFYPLGKETTATMKGKWADPKFDGNFLPVDRNVTDTSFYAKWKYFDLNRSYPQKWIGNEYNVSATAFGVDLLLPVDEYQKTTRSAKYNIMFIILTFLVLFLTELIKSLRIHPFQYLMIGFAISIFYLLLLSFSEQMSFNLSYLLSGVSVIALIGFYSRFVFKSVPMAILMAGIMLILYAFFFIILQMQDLSLLIGSIGLFLILALVMYLSRNVDWYGSGKAKHTTD